MTNKKVVTDNQLEYLLGKIQDAESTLKYAKRGIDSLHIMRLGRWESISMVERYTRSVKFEDSLKLYRSLEA